ncbi:MAG TPA: hypothetical protein VFN97_22525 [Actinospica sp.]|nr:hypothetical protein [Actinospica sp.]
MLWLPHRSPVPPREQAWIEKMLGWCVERIGEPALRGPVVEPTAAFFPEPYTGSPADALRVVDRVRALMGIGADRVEVELTVDGMSCDLAGMPPHRTRRAIVAGHYERRGDRGLIRIDPAQARDAPRLVAVAAHELCHELLLGRGGLPGADGEDHEPLTDLLTVYTGFGIFTANAAFRFESYRAGGWRTRTLGYLNAPMFGYALACYAWLRGERRSPEWAGYLDANPQGYMRQGARYLAANGPSPALASKR